MKMDRGRGRGRGGRGGQTARGGHVPQYVEANQPPPLIASSSDVWAKLGALQQQHDEDEQYWGAGDGYVESALNVETPAYVPGGGLSHPRFAAPTFGLNAASYGGYDDVSNSRSNAAPNSGYGASQAYNVPQGSAGGFGGYVASGVHAGVSNVAASYGGYDQFTAPSAAGYGAPMYQQTVSAGQSAPVPQMYSNDAPTHSGFDANRGGRGGGRAGARGGRGGAAAAGHGHGGPRGGAMHDDAEADHAGADAKAHASRSKDDGGAPRGHGQPAAAPAAPSATKPRTAQEAAAALLAAKAAAASSTTAAAAPQESKPPAAGGKFSTKASKTAAEAAAELLASKAAAAAAAASNAAAPVAAQAPPPAAAASKKVRASPANPFTGGKPEGKAAKAPAPSAEDADAAGGAFSAGAVPVQPQPAAGRSKATNAGKVHAPTDASPPPSSIPPPSEFEPVDAFVASPAAPAATRASRPSAAGAGRPARAPAKTSVSNPFAETFSTAKPATAAAGAPAAAPVDDAGAAAGAAAVAAAAEEAAARARRDEILAEYKARRDREESERRARQEADRRRRDEERRAREAAEAQRIAEENAEKQRVEDAAKAKEMERRMKDEQAKRQAEVDLKKGLPMPGQGFKKGTASGASNAPAPAAAPAGLPAQPAPVSASPSFDPKVAEEQKRRLLAQQQTAQLHQAVAASVAATAAPESSGAAYVESVEADGDHDDDHNIDSSYAAAQADAASRRAAAAAAAATRTAAPAAAASAASSSSTGVAGSDFTTWSCSACTYENYPDLLACEMCGKSKPSQKVSAAERERFAAAAAHEAAMEQQRIAREQEKISAERRKNAMEEAERLEKERKVAEIAEVKRKQEEKDKKDVEIAEARRKKADEKEKKRREKEAQDATEATEATLKLWQCLGCGSINRTDDTVQSCDKCSCKRGQKPEPKPETPVKPPAPVAAAATPAAQASAASASKPSATKSSPPKPSAATAASPAPSPAKQAPAASAAAASSSAPASASKASAAKPSPPPSAQQQQPEPIEHRTKPKLKALGPKIGPKTAAVKKGEGISKGAWCECTFENGCTFVGRCLMWDADKERYQMCTCEDADDHSAGDCDTWYHEAGIGADDKVAVKEIFPTQPAGQDDIDRPRIVRAWVVNLASRTSRGTRYFPAPKHLEALDARSVLLDCSDGVLRTAMVQGIDDGSCSGHVRAACLAVNDGGRVPFSGGEGGVGGISIKDSAKVVAPWIELDIFGSPWVIGGEGDGMPHVGGGVDTENLNVECMGMPAAALILGTGTRVVFPAPPKPINIKQSFTAAKSNIANEVLVPNGQYVAVPVFDRTTGKEDLFVGRVESYDTDSGNYYISSGTDGLYHSLRGCVWLKPNRQIKKDYDDEDFVEACLYLGHLPSTIPLPKGSPVVIDMRDGVLTSGEIAAYDPITQEYDVHITDPSASASRRGTNELVERRTCGFTAAGVLRYSTNGNCEPSNDLSAPKVALKSRPKQRASCPAGAYPIGSWVRAATGDDESPFFIGRIDGRSAVDSSSGFMYTVANKDDIVEFPHKRLTLLSAEVPAAMVALDASAAPAAANVGQLRAWPLGNVPAGVTASSLQSSDGGEVLVYEPRKQDFTIGSVVPASAGFVAGAFIAVEPKAPSTAAGSASAPALLVPLGNVWTPSSR